MFSSRSYYRMALLLPLSFCVLLQAQQAPPAPRIVAQIDNASLTVLKGNVSLMARSEFDQGAPAANTQMTGMRLILSRTKQGEAALDQFMAEQLDKSSPNYHRWLTPQQVGQIYGPAESDIDAMVKWLRSRGFVVGQLSPARSSISFSGTVQQVEQAFHTSIHSFSAAGETFLSNTSDPQIPSALAPVVSGIAQLNTIRPKPHSVKAGLGRIDAEKGRLVPETASGSRAQPNITTGSSGDYSLYVVPGDAATIYNTPNSYNAGFSSGSSYTGTGVTIGIGGEAAIETSTVANYRSNFLGDSNTPSTTYCSSNQDDSNVTSINVSCSSSSSGVRLSSDSGELDEAYLDNELAGGLAPGASIRYYASNDLMSAVQYAIDNNEVDIMSLSWGLCEWAMVSSENSYYNALWKQAAAQGIIVTVSTGDSGASGCDSSSGLFAIYGLGVNGLGSTPYNIAVGGTDYYKLSEQSNFSTYVSTSNSSSNYYRTALKYIPESVWNNSTATDWNNSTSSSYDNNIPYWSGPLSNIVGGGGGKSSCSTNTTTSSNSGSCTSGYAKPSWQKGTGVPPDGVRDIPDVSLLAANGMDNATWLVCTDDTGTNSKGKTVSENCSKQSDGNFYFAGVGGTSASTPAFAGMMALAQQAAGGRLGLDAVKTLYDLSNGSHASAVFHDVTVGNNSVYCYDNEEDCSKNSAGYYFMNGYNTNTGYDLATGLGSVDVTQLIAYWLSATGSSNTTISATPSTTSIYTGQSLTVSVTVTGSNSLGTPRGTVTLTGGGYTSSAVSLSAGSATISVPANSLSAGNDTLTATYGGDVNYSSSTGTASVTVSQSTFSVSASSAASLSRGSSTSSTITVSTSSSYAGTASLSCSLASSPSGANTTYAPSCSISPSSVTLSSSTTSATATATVTASAGTTSQKRSGSTAWIGASSEAVLAFALFLGIPARRRSWRAMLGALMLMAVLGGLSGCSGGSSSGTTETTSGTYTFSVTATGNPSVSFNPSTTFTVTVN